MPIGELVKSNDLDGPLGTMRIDTRGVDSVEIIIRSDRQEQSFGTLADRKGTITEAQLARCLIAHRRQRETVLGADLFGEPAWDMLLDLFAADAEGKQVSISSLCIAACVPATTALRWISTLERDGKIMRENDPTDARRVYAKIAPEARDQMRKLLGGWLASGPDLRSRS